MSGFWSAMDPFPAGETSQVVVVFMGLVLVLGVLGIAIQTLALIRNLKLRGLIHELKSRDEGLECQDDIDELSIQIRRICPPLDMPAQALRKSTFERNHQVYSTVSARSLFESHLPGGTPGTGLAPAALLQSLPLILVGLGCVGGLLGFMEVASSQAPTDPTLGLGALVVEAHFALRCVTWGLLMATVVYMLSRWALREAACGGSQLVDLIDIGLKKGSDEELASRLFKLQERSEENLARSAQTLETLLELQHGTAQHLLDNKTTIETLGRSIQESFTDSIIKELGPLLTQMSEQNTASSEGSQRFLEQASKQQVEGIERIISTVMEGVDQALGANLKSASESMSLVAKQQQETMLTWAESATKMAELVSELHQISDDMRQGADAISVSVSPIGEAATNFLTASSKLHEVLPSIQGASEGYVTAQTSLEETARVLQSGTEALQKMSEAQKSELEQWQLRSESMRAVLERVEGSMGQMEALSQHLSEASGPTRDASQAFADVAETLRESIPSLTGAVERQASVGAAIEAAAVQIQQGTEGYERAAQLVMELVRDLEKAHLLVSERYQSGSEHQQQQLEAWTLAVQSIHPLIAQTQSLVGEVHTSAGELNAFTTELREAAEPTREAAASFEAITQVIQTAIPTIAASVQAHDKVGEAIDHAATHLEKSTGGYHEAAALVQKLVVELDEAHRKLSAHRQASDQAQSDHLDAWNHALDHLSPTLSQLETVVQGLQGGISDIGQFTEQLARAAEPTAQAAESFRKVSEVIEGTLPAFESNRVSQEAMTAAIHEAAERIQLGTDGYVKAAELVREIVSRVDENQEALRDARRLELAAQNEQLQAWGAALDRLLPAVQSLDKGLTDIGQFTDQLAQAAEPTAKAADSFRRVSEAIEGTIPAFESNMASQEAMKTAIDEAARRIQHGTTGYLQAAELVRQVVSQIDQSQEEQTQKRSLELAAQNEQLQAWGQALDRLLPALETLKRTTVDLNGLSTSFADAAHPAIEAGAAFHNAALEVGRILPQLETAREGYEAINSSLSSTAQELARSSHAYTSAGSKVGELLSQMESSMSLQKTGNEELVKTLDRASRFTEQLPEASKLMEDAAQGLQGASLRTAEVVQNITDAVQVQDDTVGQMKETAKVLVSVLQRQTGQWEQFHSEMDRLQHVLDTSVDTFTEQMPEAIDRTLVHFDAALAEGVERLGSAVERLREAMDDLQERLEQVIEKD